MTAERSVALITGAAHRVGRAIADVLARHDYDIALHYHGAKSQAESTAAALEAHGVRVVPCQADLRAPDAPQQLMAQITSAFGRLDVLVNSAAVMVRTPFAETTVAQWDDMFALNLRAPFFLAQGAASHLAVRNGVIVNIADLAAFETWPEYIPHSITKAGVVQMTRALAHALAPHVRVNAVAPGAVLLPDQWNDEARQHLIDTTPLKRIGSPEDVANAVLYLVQADYVTGHTVLVDGGRRVRT